MPVQLTTSPPARPARLQVATVAAVVPSYGLLLAVTVAVSVALEIVAVVVAVVLASV